MPHINLSYFHQTQKEYYSFLLEYQSLFDSIDLSINRIAMFYDELNVFWLKRLEKLQFELNELSVSNNCFLLSGAIHLNVEDREHYFYKSLGDYHLLFDPFIKLEGFFRIGDDKSDFNSNCELLKEVYIDTINILNNYSEYFFFLPIHQLAIKDAKEHFNLLNTSFWNFISSIFQKDFRTEESFCSSFNSFEEIEAEMHQTIRNNLIFIDNQDREMNLRKRINRYLEDQSNLSFLAKDKNEAQVFLITISTYIHQIFDILLICMALNLIPFIRFNVTFCYLSLIMNTFIDNESFKKTIEKSIIFYVFYKSIEKDKLFSISFHEYVNKLGTVNILETIVKKLREINLDIFQGGLKRLERIVLNEFGAVI